MRDPASALAELARIDLREADLVHVLDRVAELAKAAVPGADEVSVSLVRGDRAETPAATADLATTCDEMQYVRGDGPCLAAARAAGVVLVEDMRAEPRWPCYAREAAAAGAGSSLSLGLPVQEHVAGALNIYSRRPHAFDEPAIELARGFAGYAAVAIANSQLYETTAALARQMEEAMASRAVIEQAKGLIMGQRRCSAEAAFELLVQASSRSNRKLRDVAADLIGAVQRPR